LIFFYSIASRPSAIGGHVYVPEREKKKEREQKRKKERRVDV